MSTNDSSNENTPQDLTDHMEKFGQWVEKNSKIFVGVFIALVVAVGAYWSFSMYKSSQINSAAKLSGRITKRLEMLTQAIEEAKNPEAQTFQENLDSETQKIEELVQQLVSEYPSKSLTDLAVIEWAKFLNQHQDDTQKALEYLNKVQSSDSRMLSGLLLLFKAKLVSQTEENEKALPIYDQVLANSNWSSFHGEALLQKALLLKSRGDVEEAKASLNKVKEMENADVYSEAAQKYLRLIETQKAVSKDPKKAS